MIFEITRNEVKRQLDLRYTTKRLELIESALGEVSILGILSTNKMLSFAQTKTALGYALTDEDGRHIPVKEALDMAEEIIKEKGLASVLGIVIGKLNEDLPFLFQTT